MACFSIVDIPGDPDTLASAYDQLVARAEAMGPPPPLDLAAAAVKTDKGLTVFALWDSEADFNAAWNSPDLDRASSEVGMPDASAITVTLHRAHRHHIDP